MPSQRTKLSSVQEACEVAKFLWPSFVAEHGCVFLGEGGFNPPPVGQDATGWEAFVNHTHILDEFENGAIRRVIVDANEDLTEINEFYDEAHPDFVAACELGRAAARLWALKLSQDFSSERFRVYYTEYDSPVVRFHKVRVCEPHWLTDTSIKNTSSPDLRNALVFDTLDLLTPVHGAESIHN